MNPYYQIELFIENLIAILKFLLSIVPEAIGAFIGIWGALYVLKRQTITQIESDDEKEKAEELEILNYSSFLVNSLIDTFQRDRKWLANYSTEIQTKPYNTLTPPKAVASNDANRFLNLVDGKDYLNTYVKHLGSSDSQLNEYNKIVKSVDYLSVVKEQLQELSDAAIKYDYQRRIKYNEIVIRNVNSIKDYAYDNILTHMNLLMVINPVQIVFGDDETYTMDRHSSEMVGPIIGLIQHEYSNNLDLNKMEFELHQAMSISVHLKLNNIKYSNDISQIVEYIDKTLTVLSENSRTLTKYTQDNKR